MTSLDSLLLSYKYKNFCKYKNGWCLQIGKDRPFFPIKLNKRPGHRMIDIGFGMARYQDNLSFETDFDISGLIDDAGLRPDKHEAVLICEKTRERYQFHDLIIRSIQWDMDEDKVIFSVDCIHSRYENQLIGIGENFI